jgi:hypothetical protein
MELPRVNIPDHTASQRGSQGAMPTALRGHVPLLNWPRRPVAILCAVFGLILTSGGCLPRGPISLSWPWRHSGDDCADCAGGDAAISAPHSLFHPVPTRPVFTPWMCDDAPRPLGGTVATHTAGESQSDLKIRQPNSSQMAGRQGEIRSASARSSSRADSQDDPDAPLPPREYYNPAAERGAAANSSESPAG